jgi:N-acetylneuraminic acid mutarotase
MDVVINRVKTCTTKIAVMAMMTVASVAAEVRQLRWEKLPALPPSAGQAVQPGVAGPFAGIHGGALLVAGGANFPEKLPWDGGPKVWWDDVWVLEGVAGDAPRWVTDRRFTLPRPLGYGISVVTSAGVLCAGGHDSERAYADVFLLSWEAATRTLRRTELPPMPRPLTYMAAAVVAETLYIAGGQMSMKEPAATKIFWAFELGKERRSSGGSAWRELPPWPGPARVLPVAAAQSGRAGPEFFLFGGRLPQPGGPTTLLRDAYAFDPTAGTWRVLPNIGAGASGIDAAGVSVMAGSAAAVGDSEILIVGGDRGDLFLELEAHDLAVAAARARLAHASGSERQRVEREIEQRLQAKRLIYARHPGFAREVLALNTRKNSWRVTGRVPDNLDVPVTTVAVQLDAGPIVLPSGETKPGVRTPAVLRLRPE